MGKPHPTKWSYGVTTVPSRINDLLPRTLASLRTAGFPTPRLFVDGERDPTKYRHLNLEVTTRWPNVKTYGNWILTLWELYLREPQAVYYAIFQDDFVTYRNLRQYLEKCDYPKHGYWNLYTFPENQSRAPADGATGWYLSNQKGKGAVALVLCRKAVPVLLGHPHMTERPLSATSRSFKAVDGAVVTAFQKAGWKEYVHNPSLVQHTGIKSSMQNKKHPLAPSFKGEDFDAMLLLGKYKVDPVGFGLTQPVEDTLKKLPDGDRNTVRNWAGGALGCVERRRRLAVIRDWAAKIEAGHIREVQSQLPDIEKR